MFNSVSQKNGPAFAGKTVQQKSYATNTGVSLRRRESNLLPLDYETNMQPPTPRRGHEKLQLLSQANGVGLII